MIEFIIFIIICYVIYVKYQSKFEDEAKKKLNAEMQRRIQTQRNKQNVSV